MLSSWSLDNCLMTETGGDWSVLWDGEDDGPGDERFGEIWEEGEQQENRNNDEKRKLPTRAS